MSKKYPHLKRTNWLLPVFYALPLLGLTAAALLIWGDKLRDLISIAVKLAVIS